MRIQFVTQVSVRGVLTPPRVVVDLPDDEAAPFIERGAAVPVEDDPPTTAEAPASHEPEEV